MTHTVRKIGIKDLRISCIVGLYPEERVQEQDIYIDLEIHYNFALAVSMENTENTLDYAHIAENLTHWIQQEQFILLETLAEKSVDKLYAEYSGIEKCFFTVKKPQAIPNASYAYIAVER